MLMILNSLVTVTLTNGLRKMREQSNGNLVKISKRISRIFLVFKVEIENIFSFNNEVHNGITESSEIFLS